MSVHCKSNRAFKPNTYAFTYEGLYEMRIGRGLSVYQIADLFGCDHSTVCHALKRLKVPRRSLKEPRQTIKRTDSSQRIQSPEAASGSNESVSA